jgi:hypothetical protein
VWKVRNLFVIDSSSTTSTKTIRALSRSAVLVLLISILTPSGQANAQNLRACSALWKVYPFGVARNAASAAYSEIQIDRKAYLANRRLDRDGDGMVCEDEDRQYAATTTTSIAPATTSTLPITTTTVVTQRPIPRGNFDGQFLRESTILRIGTPYMHVLCVSGQDITRSLTLSANVGGSWVKKAESYPTITDMTSWCSNPQYPVAHRFFWIPDWPGTPIDSYKSVLQLKVSGLASDAYYQRTFWTSTASETAAVTNVIRTLECAFGFVLCK